MVAVARVKRSRHSPVMSRGRKIIRMRSTTAKKLIATAVLAIAAVSSWAQGTVDFRNGGITFWPPANRYVYLGAPGPGAGDPPGSTDPGRLVGTNFVAGLWYVPGADNGALIFSPASRQAGPTFTFRPPTTAEQNKGTWLISVSSPSPVITLDGIGFLQSATLQVRVWDSVKFASFEAAMAAGDYGVSAPFNYTVPHPKALAPDLYYMNNLRAFAVIPEPSALALVIGAASLLVLRRRR